MQRFRRSKKSSTINFAEAPGNDKKPRNPVYHKDISIIFERVEFQNKLQNVPKRLKPLHISNYIFKQILDLLRRIFCRNIDKSTSQVPQHYRHNLI